MPAFSKVALFSSLIAFAASQQVGTNTPEVHPALTSYKCTSSGCTAQNTKIVIDANWRWVHGTGGYTNCYTGNKWDATLCPDDVTCAANCALEGADYAATYGITTSGNAVTLKFVTKSSGTNVGSRVYLMDTDTSYVSVNLKNSEFTFDVDVSNMPCGLNGAVYFTQMDKDGGMAKYPTNKAGAKYGTGYCDAQCPSDIKFIAGKANGDGWTPSSNDANAGNGKYGTCCSEMDIWEANSISAAYTPHVCKTDGLQACTGADCGQGSNRYSGLCDADGCDFNSYRMGDKTFYGPGLTVDTKSKFTIVTQFITSDGTQAGDLTEIRRYYVQGGKVIPNSKNTWAGIDKVNSITDAFCTQQKKVFGDTPYQLGGLKTMGDKFNAGFSLSMSIWDDHAANLLWLDSDYPLDKDATAPGVARGTCSTSSGVPADLESSVPNSSVTYSNIKFGTLGSTFTDPNPNYVNPGTGSSSGSSPTTTSSTKKAKTTTTTSSKKKKTTTTTKKAKTTTAAAAPAPATTTAAAPATGSGASKYGQCGGGSSWTGPTTCQSGLTCTVLNPYYSQCL